MTRLIFPNKPNLFTLTSKSSVAELDIYLGCNLSSRTKCSKFWNNLNALRSYWLGPSVMCIEWIPTLVYCTARCKIWISMHGSGFSSSSGSDRWEIYKMCREPGNSRKNESVPRKTLRLIDTYREGFIKLAAVRCSVIFEMWH